MKKLLVLAFVLGLAVAGHLAAGAVAQEAGYSVVHFCDLDGECRQSHPVLTSGRFGLPVRMATVAESVAAVTEYELGQLPATVLYRGGEPLGAVVGQRRPELLRDELAEVEMTLRGGEALAPVAPTVGPEPDTGLVVFVDVRVRAGQIQILGAEVMAGAAPKPSRDKLDSHRVELLDAFGVPLVTRAWQATTVAVAPPPLPGQEATGPEAVLSVRTGVALPYHPDAVTVRIEQPFGLTAGLAPLGRTPDAQRPPRATPLHNTGPDDERMVLLIMGDEYRGKTGRKRFVADAQDHSDFFLSVKPFNRKQRNINVYRAATRKGLRCHYVLAADGKDSRLLICNNARVLSRAARHGISYDEILVLVNSEKYGGSGQVTVGGGGPEGYGVTYNGAAWGLEVGFHELGHSFLGLMDEYTYGTDGAPWGPNCQAAPCTWKGKGLGCFEGCSYNGLSRPTENRCLMENLSPPNGFNLCKVGLKQAKKVIRRY